MYVESKPLSVYGATDGWVMPRQPSPQLPGTLRRPPVPKSGSFSSAASSASSLSGMEQSIPSFKSFVSRTPTPDSLKSHKPLPPTPLSPRRTSSSNHRVSRAPSSLGPRKTSSIYSRAFSEATRESSISPSLRSWQTNDLGDESDLLLRPIAYSASTSNLVETRKEPLMLEPRTYAPLITSPSPTVSRASTPSVARSKSPSDSRPDPVAAIEPRPSILLPEPTALAQIPKKHLRTVSLEKAKEIMQAPGKVHLLPEELRAQTMRRARSQEPTSNLPGHRRLSSLGAIDSTVPVEITEVSTLTDSQGRERLVTSQRFSQVPAALADYFPPNSTSSRAGLRADSRRRSSVNPFLVDKGRAKLRASQMHGRKKSRGKNVPALTIDTGEKPRGRTKVRGQRNSKESDVIATRDASQASTLAEETGLDLAKEYYKLLDGASFRSQSPSVASRYRDDSIEVMAKMKMIPQPLFHRKPSAAGTIRKHSSGSGVSPSHGRSYSSTTVVTKSKHGFSDSRGTLPLRLSLSLRPGFNRRSTSGDIPVSPPPDKISSFSFPRPMSVERPKVDASPQRKNAKSRRRSSGKKSFGFSTLRKSRKEKSLKGKDKAGPEPQMPARPLMAADIMAEISKASNGNEILSPLRSNPHGPVPNAHSPPASDTSSIYSIDPRRPFHQRMFKGAAKYADKLTRTTEEPGHGRKRSDDVSPGRKPVERTLEAPAAQNRLPASPTSPIVVASPTSWKSRKTVASLGWSDTAKFSFDQAHTPSQSPLKKRAPQTVEHISTPARPLNESVAHLRDDSLTRRPSILHSLMESWNERKAERRRGDLKKIIKVVTPAHLAEQEDEVAAPRSPGLFERRPSLFAAVSWRSGE